MVVSCSSLGTDPLNLASKNDPVPFPCIPITLTKRDAVLLLLLPLLLLLQYRSVEKSIHMPRLDRSADRTASPTNDGGRLGSYADERH